MTKRLPKRQPLFAYQAYLRDDQHACLDAISDATRIPKSVLIREGVDKVIAGLSKRAFKRLHKEAVEAGTLRQKEDA